MVVTKTRWRSASHAREEEDVFAVIMQNSPSSLCSLSLIAAMRNDAFAILSRWA